MEAGGPNTFEQPGRAVKERPVKFWVASAIGVIVALGLLAVAGNRGMKVSRAKRDVNLLVLALDGFAAEQGHYPTGTVAEVCALLRGESVGGQNRRELDYIAAKPHEMNAAGEFLDPWGTPYRIFALGPRAYSCGPNRVDEEGKGDDIASWR